MSTLSKTILALALTTALAGAAHAQGGGEMRPLGANMGYGIDMKGNVKILDLPAATVKKMMTNARKIPRNVVIFMQGGTLMMADWPSGH